MSDAFETRPHPPAVNQDTPLRRLARASGFLLGRVCERLAGNPKPGGLRDRLDERLARSRRKAFGRRSCVLSWHRQADGSWRARLSGPGLERTIERTGRSRVVAVARSARALRRIYAFRARSVAPPDFDPGSRHANAP